MSESSRGSIRVSIDNNFHEFYKQLSESNDPEKAPFRTMKDIFMLAVCLGYSRGNRKSITGSRRQIFHWAQFSEQVDIPILKSVAIASTNDIQILTDPEQIVQIAEEYAHTGIYDLHSKMDDRNISNLWTLVHTLRQS